MRIIDLPADLEGLYFQCLGDWSEEMQDAGFLKRQWYERMRGRGLRVKLALDDRGAVGAMIHHGPIENVAVQGCRLCSLRHGRLSKTEDGAWEKT